MKTFKVTLSEWSNPDKFKFITVEDCVDIDDCVKHVWSTEGGFVIEQIKEVA